ncbi:MAG: endolytic transglycosylase MltG, partial [Solirubrobacterales bacterium]
REARRRGRRQSLGEKAAAGAAPAQTPPAETPAPAATQPPPTSEQPQVPAAAEPVGPNIPPAATAPGGSPPPRPPARGPRVRSSAMRNRRVIGAILFIALLGLVIFGVVKVLGKLTEEDPPAPATTSKPAPKTTDLLIVEGLTREQIADEVAKNVKGDYMKASDSPPKDFDLEDYDAENAPNLEGFLFPATYPIVKKETAKELVSQQLEAFRSNFDGVDLSYAKSKNLTPYDVLIIASMIEKEIQVPEERKLAAAVIYNRLKAGDTLGIDATIRYYLGNYDEQLTQSELADPHPYNTRVNPGLPPTPISNPGVASIDAAANPAKSDAYFFVVKPGTCGEHVFVETQEEFAQAEQAYQQALQEQGGSPTDC